MKKTKNKFPKSLKKHIRVEKSRIKKGLTTSKEMKEMVDKLYKKITKTKKS